MKAPCEHCPWRLSNHGKKTPWGFFTKANLRRLWNQIRRAADAGRQSCHPTDASHPDHIAAGAKPGLEVQECVGSVILVRREFLLMRDESNAITPESVKAYLASRKDGLTKAGVMYWLIARHQFGGVPLVGGAKMPAVNDEEVGIARLGREAEATLFAKEKV